MLERQWKDQMPNAMDLVRAEMKRTKVIIKSIDNRQERTAGMDRDSMYMELKLMQKVVKSTMNLYRKYKL